MDSIGLRKNALFWTESGVGYMSSTRTSFQQHPRRRELLHTTYLTSAFVTHHQSSSHCSRSQDRKTPCSPLTSRTQLPILSIRRVKKRVPVCLMYPTPNPVHPNALELTRRPRIDAALSGWCDVLGRKRHGAPNCSFPTVAKR